MSRETRNEKLELIGRLYDEGASLPKIIREVGTDEASLRLIHADLGVAMSTLRREAAALAAPVYLIDSNGRAIGGSFPTLAAAEDAAPAVSAQHGRTVWPGTNPVVRTTALRAYPGWIVREYRDGMYDATDGRGLTMGVRSFAEAVAEVARPDMGGPKQGRKGAV